MTAADGDGIDQELTRAVSAAMIAAARASEQIARMNQASAREREARAAGDTVEAQRQLDAHTESARAYFEVVTRPEYLGAATDEQVQEVTRQAQAWRERLPEAQRAEQAATGELGARQTPDSRGAERAAVLANEAEVADRLQPTPVDVTDQSPSEVSQAGKGVAATADVAQARPAREAPAGGHRRAARLAARRPRRSSSQQSGLDR